MIDVRRLGQIILARLVDEVPELGGRVYDRAAEDTAFPYLTMGPLYGVDDRAECIDAEEWTIQLDVWDKASNKLRATDVVQKVSAALRDWSDVDQVTMHPLRVVMAQVMDDPTPGVIHGVVQVEAAVEG